MNLTPHVEELRRQLAVAADAGGEEARALAERLMSPLESAVRLTLLDVLSEAADEISRDLAPGSVELRLRGREPAFAVTVPAFDETTEPARDAGMAPTMAPPEPDDTAMVRINLRLSEHLKARVEEAADAEGLSVNAWLVRAATAALDGPGRESRSPRRVATGGQRYTGWVR